MGHCLKELQTIHSPMGVISRDKVQGGNHPRLQEGLTSEIFNQHVVPRDHATAIASDWAGDGKGHCLLGGKPRSNHVGRFWLDPLC